MKLKRILLAGGSGFIGRALARALVTRGYEVVVLTRTPRTDSGLSFTAHRQVQRRALAIQPAKRPGLFPATSPEAAATSPWVAREG